MVEQESWVERSARFEIDRKHLCQLFVLYGDLNMADVYRLFLANFRYLPDLERRMRELVKEKKVEIIFGEVKKYRLV